MSAFLSKIHYQLYDKIKYQATICETLHNVLHKQEPFMAVLPKGELKEVIDHEHIHDWLLHQIKLVESQMSSLLDAIKQTKQREVAKDALYQAGKVIGEKLVLQNTIEIFQHLQTYMLDGMPCMHGITLLRKAEQTCIFQCALAVHSNIADFAFYMELRLCWIQGLLQNTEYIVTLQEPSTFTIEKEVSNV